MQSTPPAEIIGHDLIKEFAERCQNAVRTVQGYISSDNPAPDEETLVTLIETNDELSVALSQYQRSILKARKAMGTNTPPVDGTASSEAARPVLPPPVPSRQNGTESATLAELPAQPVTSSAAPIANGSDRYEYRADEFQVQNPFADNNAADEEAPVANGSSYGAAATHAGPSGYSGQPLASNPVH